MRILLLSLLGLIPLTQACEWLKKKDYSAKSPETAPSNVSGPGIGGAPPPPPLAKIQNLAYLTEPLRLDPYYAAGLRGQKVMIAVLDNGFIELAQSLGKTLPPSTILEKPAEDIPANTIHGTKMAEIAYAVATGQVDYDASKVGPEMRLFQTNGPFRNFERAIDRLIELKTAQPERTIVVLYAQIWEAGGNGDARGFINKQVERALAKGVFWVNAAGNLGNSTYFAELEVRPDRSIKLPFEEKYLRLVVPNNQTPVKMILGWSDFSDQYGFFRTAKDLNLSLEDANHKLIIEAKLIQDGKDHSNAEGYSKLPREQIQATLNSGIYYLSAKDFSGNFTSQDRFWVSASGPGVYIDQANGKDHIFAPADNPQVLTVGGLDIDYGNSNEIPGLNYRKPEVLAQSRVTFDNGFSAEGTSTATAVAAGAMATYLSAFGMKDKAQIDQEISDFTVAKPAEQFRGPPGMKALSLRSPP